MYGPNAVINMKQLLLHQIIYFTLTRGFSLSEWRPLGQGDPLIDPTHVYSPPMVEHVHYWLEPRHRPRVELPGTNKGPTLGFAQAIHHHQKFSSHGDSDMYRGPPFGPPKEVFIEQYGSTQSTPIQQSYSFPLRSTPSFISDNYPPNPASQMQSFIRGPFGHFEPQKMTTITSYPMTPSDVKEMYTQVSSTMPPTTSPDDPVLSLSLKPPPKHAVTLGQVAGWPQISTHLQPSNYQNNDHASTETTLPLTTTNEPTYPTTISTTTTTTTTTTTKSPPTSPPVSLVIEGHSKVKKYGPLPETANSIHLVNHNHLTSKNVCEQCIDLPIAKVKEISNPS